MGVAVQPPELRAFHPISPEEVDRGRPAGRQVRGRLAERRVERESRRGGGGRLQADGESAASAAAMPMAGAPRTVCLMRPATSRQVRQVTYRFVRQRELVESAHRTASG